MRLHLFFTIIISLAFFNAIAERRQVEIIHADRIKSLKHGESSINRLIGNVKLWHNGTTMTCDSAYLYPDNRFEAFSRVVINKDTTWLYGDYMDYESERDLGKVRGEIVTMLDGETRLRTQFLDFNTATNVTYFSKGGTIDNGENLLESIQGTYYSDQKLAIFDTKVEMRNQDYSIKSDSLHYFTDDETALFFKQTYVFHDDVFMSFLEGSYQGKIDYFFMTQNVYMMSKEQEAWSDTAQYYRSQKESDMFGNVQLFDSTQYAAVLAEHVKILENQDVAFATRNPVGVIFSENPADDTMFIKADTLLVRRITITDTIIIKALDTSLNLRIDSLLFDSTDLQLKADTLTSTSIDTTLTTPRIDAITQVQATDSLPTHAIDTLSIDSIPHQEKTDTLNTIELDSSIYLLANDSVYIRDSVLQYFHAYNKVRFYHPELQGYCDSLAHSEADSLTEMFYDPILWNQENQMTGDQINAYQKNNQIHSIELDGNGFMASEDDTVKQYYNQIKGKLVIAKFAQNDLYQIDVFGNGQTVMFLREAEKLSGVNNSTSSELSIYVKNRKVQRVSYLSKPVSNILPPRKITAEEVTLRGLSWRGDIRPRSRYEITSRSFYPSQRYLRASIGIPTFSITSRLNQINDEPKKR
ncbi:MAG: OstA-like protein [Bacteroidales bacterium]